MIKHNQIGAANGLMLSFIVTVLLLIAAVIFGVWAFGSRQDFKNNTDAKINAAVDTAVKNEDVKNAATYAEQSKYPLATYTGPQAYGSLTVQYPKSWSGYVDDSGQGNALIDGYFNPGVVPSVSSQKSVFALRVQVVNQSYSQVLQSYSGQQQENHVTVAAYALPKLPNIVGVEVTGQLANQSNGTMVILPLRANTLEIWTQGNQYLSDFNNNILKNFSFSP